MTTKITPDLCVALANHWSYTGIGWQLGLESCAQSVEDSLKMADYEPSVRTGLNFDALAYELIAEKYPELTARLKRNLDQGRVEIIGGTFGQPMGSMVSGESNLRQLVVGQQAIRRALGRTVAVFLEEEEMSHPQIPQLVTLAGYRYASLAQCDTWGRHGAPKIEKNVIIWEGVDGTRVVATPCNAMVFHPPAVTHDIDWLWTGPGRAGVDRMKQLGQPPLILKWTEFGWEDLNGKSMNKFEPALFKTLSGEFRVEYVTVEQYLDRHGSAATETVRLKMDDFEKLLPWGVGGDQVRRFGRQVEAILLAAERFDAVAHALGLESSPLDALAQAWRELLASQSHDVSLCEYSRWNGGSCSPPREPVMDAHFLSWGAMGYRHMDRAADLGRPVLQRALTSIAAAVDTSGSAYPLAAVAFNPSGFDLADVAATTGKVPLAGMNARGLRVRNATGKEIPWQLLDHRRDEDGTLTHADLLFQAESLPGVGYDTFYLEPTAADAAPPATGLRVDEQHLRIENALVAVALDPVSGAIAGITDCRTGKELLSSRRPFPTLFGHPNGAAVPARHAQGIVAEYDTSKSQARIVWVEKGPLRATALAIQPSVRGMRFEVYVSLEAASPTVRVHARFFPDMPPLPDKARPDTWQYDLNIEEGYWLEFAPSFEPASVIRDYPFGVEPCDKKAIDALTFLDLLDADGGGLFIAHGGTQYFKRRSDGIIANLAVRDWESHFTGEYGWPRVCEYHYALTPHGPGLTHTDRARLAEAIDHSPRCVVTPAQPGRLSKRRGFVRVEGGGASLSAFRRSEENTYELRLFEGAGAPADARVATTLPFATARPINALGESSSRAEKLTQPLDLKLRPWEIKNLELKP